MSEQWHFIRGDKQSGPVSAAELTEMAASGHLSPSDMVWRVGMPKWAPAGKLKGLFSGVPKAGEQPAAEKPNTEADDYRPSSPGQPPVEDAVGPIISINRFES